MRGGHVGRITPLENDTQSFIIRIWHERVDEEKNITVWRGSIDHVGTGKRLYFHDLNGIARFIQDYLQVKQQHPPKWKVLIEKLRHESDQDS